MNHKENCGENDIRNIGTSSDSLFQWKNRFHKNPI